MLPSEQLALLSFTIQLLRLSIDLIRVASSQSALAGNVGDVHHGASHRGSHHGHGHHRHQTEDVQKDKTETTSKEQNLTEDQPLLAGTRPQISGKSYRAVVLSILWAIYAIVFFLAAINNSSSQGIFNTPVLWLATSISILEIIMLVRDSQQERYGSVQRTLQLSAALATWFGIASVSLVSSPVMIADRCAFVAVTLGLFTVVMDSWMARRYPTPARQKIMEQTVTKTKQKLSRKAIVTLLKPYFWPDATDDTAVLNRLRAIATWFCVMGSKGLGLFSPLLLGWASTALAHQDYTATMRYSCLYALVTFIKGVLSEGQSLMYLRVAQAAFVQLSETAFAHLHSLSLDWHLRKKLGEVLRGMDRGIDACDTLMKYLFLWLLPALGECVVVCFIFATYFQYMPLALSVFYFVFVYVVWTIILTLWRKKFRKALVQSDNDWHDRFTDSLINFETVKFFTAERYELSRFCEAVSHYQEGSVHVKASLSFLNISQQMLLQTCLAVALSLTAWGVKQRADCCVTVAGCESGISDCCRNVDLHVCPGMQVGDFVAVLTYTLNLFSPLNFLGSIYNAVVMAVVDLSNLSELLAEEPDVTDAPDAFSLPSDNIKDHDTVVEFDNVYFCYPTQSDRKGLKGVSFRMKKGTTTAIVGPTGAGKTTIGRLLFRFYDVMGGAVKVNGVDVRSVTQESLRGSIGVVPQAASMFNDTIRSNIQYGRRDANHQELEQAAKDAQLLDFIESLDDGWDTMVGDRGLKLSGGEKQRAAIARCLLKDPPIVLLDEATSALDSLTESSVQEALDRLGKKRTVLVIAHRLGTIRHADNIIVLKDGHVAEEGSHDKLLTMNGMYAEMWNKQLHSVSNAPPVK